MTRHLSVDTTQVAAPVQACAVSNDCRHLLASAGKGFVFRYEHNPRHTSTQVGLGFVGRSTNAVATKIAAVGEIVGHEVLAQSCQDHSAVAL